jgi:hypothetical protein
VVGKKAARVSIAIGSRCQSCRRRSLRTRHRSRAGASHNVSLDELAHQLTADIAKSDVRSVAVADFLGDNGQKSDLGMYLAEKLSDGFEATPDRSFRFLDRAAMQASKVTVQDSRLA